MKIQKLLMILVVLSLLSSVAFAATSVTQVWVDPAVLSVSQGASGTVNVKINPIAADTSSVKVVGNYDPTKITPTFTAALVGADGMVWGGLLVNIKTCANGAINPPTCNACASGKTYDATKIQCVDASGVFDGLTTFVLLGATLNAAGNWLPAGTQSVLKIVFSAVSQGTTMVKLISATVNTVVVSDIAGSTITITAPAPACVPKICATAGPNGAAATCGTLSDGCGGTLSCGTCTTLGTSCDATTFTCKSTLTLVVCGNGKVEIGEGCDDGNTINLDGCSSTCAVETGYTCTKDTLGKSICSKTTVNLCSGITCPAVKTTCADGFVVGCTPTCVLATGICGTCTPDCTGHTIAPACTSGQRKCQSATEYQECVNGQWSTALACTTAGTTCNAADGQCLPATVTTTPALDTLKSDIATAVQAEAAVQKVDLTTGRPSWTTALISKIAAAFKRFFIG